MQHHLQLVGHLRRMGDSHIPNQLVYGLETQGKREACKTKLNRGSVLLELPYFVAKTSCHLFIMRKLHS